jgi:RNA polymerase sigma-70 factor (ECF subfamily)
VCFEGDRDVRANRRDHVRAERQVWHELPIHHVELDAIDTGLFERHALVTQPRKVGRQHGRHDLDRSIVGDERAHALGPYPQRRRPLVTIAPARHGALVVAGFGHPEWASAAKSGQTMETTDLREVSDAVLVIAISRYDQQALAEAYRRHAGAVFALAQRLLGERARAEEIVQEVYLRLWNRPELFDPERGSLRSYLLAQCHGRTVDLLRSETSRRNREEKDARRTAQAGYDVEREVVDLVVAERVRGALDGLQTNERRAIELAYLGGHTYREVADLLNEPEGTVKSRIRSGLKKMRQSLQDVGVGGLR